MDNVKKSIILHWFNAIFVAKTIPKEDFTGRKAHEVLSQANFTIPYNKEFEANLKELTAEFRTAVKEKRVAQLLEQYPLPKFITEDEAEEESKEMEEIYEPTAEEVKTVVFNFLRGVDIQTISTKDVLNHVKEKFEMSFKHRKSEIKHYIEDFVNSQKVSIEADAEEERMDIEVPKVKKPVRDAKGAKSYKKVKVEKKDVEEKKMLTEEYWKINSQIQEIKEKIALERGKLVNEDGSIDNDVEADIKELKAEEKVLLGRLKEIEGFIPKGAEAGKQGGPIIDIISRSSVAQSSETSNDNLKYIAFLTYYVISPLINVEGLEYTFKQYPDIPAKFKNDFINLTVKDRYKFASSIINSRKFKTIADLVKNGEPLNASAVSSSIYDVNIDVSLANFMKQAEEKNVDDEIRYNLMKYVSPNLDYPLEIIIKNVSTELRRITRSSSEDIEAKVDRAVGVSSDRKMISEKVHTDVLKNIKDFVKEKYLSLYGDNPEEQARIQAFYDDVRIPLYIPDIDFTERLPVEDMIKYVPEMSKMRSEIKKLVSIFKNSKNKADLYNIKKEIEMLAVDKALKKSERTQFELDLVKKKLKNGEITQDIAGALDTFIRLYDSISNLPTKTSDENIFEFNRLEHLPEKYRPEVEKMLRERISQSMSNLNAFHAKENATLTKIQIELDKSDKVDILSIADKINSLETSEEIKTKLLGIIKKDEKINVFMTYRKLNNVILLNPLEYRGIRRAKRVKRANEAMNEIDKIKAQFPKKSHTIDYCLTYLYTKPWLNLPQSYGYFLAHPNDFEKDMLDLKERFLFGSKITPSASFKAYQNLYIPTTTFWKVYCTEFLVYRNGMYSCDYNAIDRDFLNLNTNKYVLGVYNKENNDDFRIFTKEDFDKECDWFKNNDMGSLTTLDKFSYIDLNLNHKLAKASREYMRQKIKAILIILYKNYSKSNNMIDRHVLKLETELFNQCEVNGKRPFFVYVYETLMLLYLIDPASPLYDFTSFYQQLFLTSKSYDRIVEISKRLYDAVPTLYLLPSPQKTIAIINSKVKYDTENVLMHIRQFVEPGFKFQSKSTSHIQKIISDSDITSQFNSFDPKRFKNVCSNYEDVKDPFIITSSNNKLICVGKKQVYDILTDNVDATASIPEHVKEYIKQLLKVREGSSEFARIMAMEFVAKDFLAEHYLYIISITDNNISEDKHVKEALEMLSSVISGVTANEKVLFIDHLVAEAYNTLLTNVQVSIDEYIISDDLKEEFNIEANKRRKLYYNDDLYNNDRDERKRILSSLFNYLENLYGELNDDIKDTVVDYVSSKIDIEFKEEKVEYIPYVKSYNCSICLKKSADDNLKTYLYSKGKRELAHFCSMKCFKQLSEEKLSKDIGKDDIKQVELHILVDKIISPIKLTYEELIDRTKIAGISLPQNIPFEQAYVSWLSAASFADKIWLEIQHQNLDEIAKRFNIQEDNVINLWNKLKNNSDFYSLFIDRLSSVAKPYTKYVSDTVELFSEECPYPKVLVNEFITKLVQETKSYFSDENIVTFSFEEILFKPFFIAFGGKCSDIQNTVQEAKVSGSNIKLLDEVVAYFGFSGMGPNENELNDKLIKVFPKYMKKKGDHDIENFKSSPLSYIKEILLKKLTIPSNTTFEKMMNDDISGKNAPHYLRTLIGDTFGLPIETGSTRVQLYKNFLANIGLVFIREYINNYNVSEPVQAEYVKRKPTEKTKKINALSIKLENLKKKSLDLTTSQINLKTQIDGGSRGLEQELKQQKEQGKAVEEQITEVTDEINKLVGASSVKKVVAKKGLFKGSVKPKKSLEEDFSDLALESGASGPEKKKVEEPAKSYYTSTEIDKILREKLLMDIANRFPEGSDMYSIAQMIDYIPSNLTKDVLTVAMIKGGKYTAEKAKKEEMDMLDEFSQELENDFGVLNAEDGEEAAGYDDDIEELEDFGILEDNENEDALEDNYERGDDGEGEFY